MYQRGLGYYVTKQPANVNISYDQAREEEAEYFSSDIWTKHFAHLEGSNSRFGTTSLQFVLAKENERQLQNTKLSLLNAKLSLNSIESATKCYAVVEYC